MKKILVLALVAAVSFAFNASALSFGVVGGAGFGSQASSSSAGESGVVGQSASALAGVTGGTSFGSTNSNGYAASGLIGTNSWAVSNHNNSHVQGNANASLGLAGTTQNYGTGSTGSSAGQAGFGAGIIGGIFGP